MWEFQSDKARRLVLAVLLPNLWGIWIWPQGAKEWGKSTCAGATEGVYVPLLLCACMGTGTNLRWGESTQISIIRGFWGPPLSPWLRFTSLSHHPSAALAPIHLPLSTQPPSPPYPSIPPSVSMLPFDPSLIPHFHSPPWPHPLTLILIITFYIVGI